jgi:glycosyltransferase involved in cell wall biosynthesis
MSRRSLNDYQKNIPGARFAEKFFHGRVTAVLGNSRAVVDELLDEGVDSGKTHLIYNGVDSKKIHIEQGTKSLPVQADIFIYCVSNFIQYKGHKDLIDALAQLKREQYPTWHVVCFGRDDGILSSLKSYARKSGVGDRFSWIENQLAPWEFMQKGQIGILPSHQEGFSNALLEMMACELAVIATDVGGNREALESDVGIIVSARNSGEMSGGIRLLLGCAEDRAKYSRRAKLAAQEKFSITAYVDAYEDVYERYLSTTHKTATKP